LSQPVSSVSLNHPQMTCRDHLRQHGTRVADPFRFI